jgi:hypothetical protein
VRHNVSRVGIASAEQLTNTKAQSDKENSGKDPSCTEDLYNFVDVRRGEQYQQDKTNATPQPNRVVEICDGS